MNTEQRIWMIVFILGAIGLLIGAMRGVGAAYVQGSERSFQYGLVTPDPDLPAPDPDSKPAEPEWVNVADEAEAARFVPVPETGDPISWMVYTDVEPNKRNNAGVVFSLPRTIGIWVAGLLTIFILSFLYKDNAFYKLAEAIVVGSSAAYVMVAGFWSQIVENLFGKLTPGVIRAWAKPGLDPDAHIDIVYIFPLILSALLLWRLAPKGAWIARWPLAFFIGATAGFRLIGFLEADFVAQIRTSIYSMWVTDADGVFQFWPSVGAITILVGVLSCLTYFFFSIEHKGVVGKTARLGIWFLMITFGAGFGYTVMGRIALLAERLQFLFDDWLWLIDPIGKRLGM